MQKTILYWVFERNLKNGIRHTRGSNIECKEFRTRQLIYGHMDRVQMESRLIGSRVIYMDATCIEYRVRLSKRLNRKFAEGIYCLDADMWWLLPS